MNQTIHNNNYQMLNIDSLIQLISQNLGWYLEQGGSFFITIGLKYAYSQLNRHLETLHRCIFNILGINMTSTYASKHNFTKSQICRPNFKW